MWATASTTALWTLISTGVGSMLFTVISSIIVVIVGLMVLGFAIRKVKHYVTGRKF